MRELRVVTTKESDEVDGIIGRKADGALPLKIKFVEVRFDSSTAAAVSAAPEIGIAEVTVDVGRSSLNTAELVEPLVAELTVIGGVRRTAAMGVPESIICSYFLITSANCKRIIGMRQLLDIEMQANATGSGSVTALPDELDGLWRRTRSTASPPFHCSEPSRVDSIRFQSSRVESSRAEVPLPARQHFLPCLAFPPRLPLHRGTSACSLENTKERVCFSPLPQWASWSDGPEPKDQVTMLPAVLTV
uniref:Uncharacterized protein n=1 Tax=Setaria digitata TaxID=48799 RepID=A0A915Q4C1_9BILA